MEQRTDPYPNQDQDDVSQERVAVAAAGRGEGGKSVTPHFKSVRSHAFKFCHLSDFSGLKTAAIGEVCADLQVQQKCGDAWLSLPLLHLVPCVCCC